MYSKIIFFLLLILPISFADGMVHYLEEFETIWRPLDVNRQYCAMNYQDGFEKMILTISVNDIYGSKAVWLFPVPAEPDDIVIDILKEFPRFYYYQ